MQEVYVNKTEEGNALNLKTEAQKKRLTLDTTDNL